MSLFDRADGKKKRSCVFWKSGREVLNRPTADHSRDDEMHRRRGRAQTFGMQPMVAVLCCSVRAEMVCAFMLCSSRGGNLPFLSPCGRAVRQAEGKAAGFRRKRVGRPALVPHLFVYRDDRCGRSPSYMCLGLPLAPSSHVAKRSPGGSLTSSMLSE